MINYIKKNIIIIVYILTILSDIVTKFSSELDLTSLQLNVLKGIGAILAVLLTQAQAIIVEKTKVK